MNYMKTNPLNKSITAKNNYNDFFASRKKIHKSEIKTYSFFRRVSKTDHRVPSREPTGGPGNVPGPSVYEAIRSKL